MARQERFVVKAVLLLGLTFLSSVVQGAEPNYSLYFDVTKFGAEANGDKNNAQAFTETWAKACGSGAPAKVLIPSGTFLTGPVVFSGPCKSAITVEVRGIVKATTDLKEYADGDWILFENIDGLLLTGGGTFDGQGAASWKLKDSNPQHSATKCDLLPISIKFNHVNNSVVTGINSLNSKGFHILLVFCQNFTASNLNITAPDESPNTDGIHLSLSSFVNITNSKIGTGDDCVSIGHGSTDISVSRITCGPGHGISVGSLGNKPDEMDVNGITVFNCTLINTTNGLRIKTKRGSASLKASRIFYDNIIMDKVKNPIIIDQNYGAKKNEPSRVKITNVHYKNIKGTSITNVGVNLNCSSVVPCDGVELVGVDLAFDVGSAKKAEANLPFSSSCANAEAKFEGKISPPPC